MDQSLIVPGFPIIEAEIIFCCRHEWAQKPEDILERRTRIAFLNKNAALAALPKVASIMGVELGWSSEHVDIEIKACAKYINESFSGPK